MVELHQILGVLAIAVNAIAGAIGGLTLWRHVEPWRAYAHLVAFGQTTLIGQAAVGLLLLSSGKRSADELHYLYGAVALGAVLSPWIYAPPEPRARLVWFTGASLLAAALSVRGYMTGS